jgi:O-antigen/teichoic acid export membrane protein
MHLTSDTAAQLIAHVFAAALSVILLVWMAATASAAEFGEYTIFIYWSALLAVLMDGGWKSLITRETTRPSSSLAAVTLDLPKMATIQMAAVIALLAPITLLVLDLGLSVLMVAITQAIAQFQSARYRGLNQLRRDAFFLLLFRLFSVAGTYLGFTHLGQTAEAAVAGTALGQSPVILLHIATISKLSTPKLNQIWFRLFREGATFLSIDAATALYLRLPVILLGLTSLSQAEVGSFALAHRLLDLTAVVMAPLGVVYFNRIRRAGLPRESSIFTTLLVAIPAATAIGFAFWAIRHFNGELITTFLDSGYSSAANLLPFFTSTIALMILNCFLTNHAIAANLTTQYAQATYLALISMLLASAVLIPTIGTTGAAASLTVYELVLAVRISHSLSVRRASP